MLKINQALANYMEVNGLKMNFVAEKAGIAPDAFSRICLGKRKISADEYISICDVLNLDPRFFRKTIPKNT